MKSVSPKVNDNWNWGSWLEGCSHLLEGGLQGTALEAVESSAHPLSYSQILLLSPFLPPDLLCAFGNLNYFLFFTPSAPQRSKIRSCGHGELPPHIKRYAAVGEMLFQVVPRQKPWGCFPWTDRRPECEAESQLCITCHLLPKKCCWVVKWAVWSRRICRDRQQNALAGLARAPSFAAVKGLTDLWGELMCGKYWKT